MRQSSNRKAITKSGAVCLCLGIILVCCIAGKRCMHKYMARTAHHASRGRILDRNGRVLAANIATVSVFADTRRIRDTDAAATKLADLLGMSPNLISAKLGTKHGFVWLGRQLDAGVGDRILKMKDELPGVDFQYDSRREYPMRTLAAQVIGFNSVDNKGLEGIEWSTDKILSGRNGTMGIPAVDGKDVRLTIDVNTQQAAEEALAKMAKSYHPKSACAIVMDPKTGEILALANYPTCDANSARMADSSLWRNRAVADLCEPGTAFRAFILAAALNEKISADEIIAQCNGHYSVGRREISCDVHAPSANGHGPVDLHEISRYSCNIGSAALALRLGQDKLAGYLRAFGFFDKCQAGFGCESIGYARSDWSPIRIANVGFGQGIAVTPLHLAVACAGIANKGLQMEPAILREVRDADGKVFQAFKSRPMARVISAQAAGQLGAMMTDCVENGSSKTAHIDGYEVAGMSGTAQAVRADGRGYEPGAYVVSFIGFAPAKDPKLAVAVVINRPKNSHWGAVVAAPVFRDVCEKTLLHPGSGRNKHSE